MRDIPALFRDMADEQRFSGTELEMRLYHPSAAVLELGFNDPGMRQSDAYRYAMDNFLGVCGQSSATLRDVYFDGPVRTGRGLSALQSALAGRGDAGIRVNGKAHSWFVEKRGDTAHVYQSYLGKTSLTQTLDNPVTMPTSELSRMVTKISDRYREAIELGRSVGGGNVLHRYEQSLFGGQGFDRADFPPDHPGGGFTVEVSTAIASPRTQRERMREMLGENARYWDNLRDTTTRTLGDWNTAYFENRLDEIVVSQPSRRARTETTRPQAGSSRSARPASGPTQDPARVRPVPPREVRDYQVFGNQSFTYRHAPQVSEHGSFPAYRPAQPRVGQDRPPLLVSDDGTLAMNAAVEGGADVQEVYATEDIVAHANALLASVESEATLELDRKKGVVLPTGTTLYQVRPRFRREEGLPDVCRDFSAKMLGGQPEHLVLRGADGVLAVHTSSDSGLELTGTHHLAEAMVKAAQQNVTGIGADWASRVVAQDSRRSAADGTAPMPGKAYGEAIAVRNPNQRAAMLGVARQIGVNEFAWANVGEGYVINSIGGPGDRGKPAFDVNYARRGDGGATYGYHFGTVMLASADGRTQVTLENFARGGQHRAASNSALEQNLHLYAGQYDQIRSQLKAQRPSATGEAASNLETRIKLAGALRDIEKHRRTGDGQAENSARTVANHHLATLGGLPSPGKLWHFRMYTPAPGQTFHERQSELYREDRRAALVNPLTMVVVGGHGSGRPRHIGFARRAHTLDNRATSSLQHTAGELAREAVWRNRHHVRQPSVEITGHGNSLFTAERTGMRRAENVRTGLDSMLESRLGQLQLSTRDPIHSDQIRMDVRSGRRTEPAVALPAMGPRQRRRSVVVQVVDPPYGQRSVAAAAQASAAYPQGTRHAAAGAPGDPRAQGWDHQQQPGRRGGRAH